MNDPDDDDRLEWTSFLAAENKPRTLLVSLFLMALFVVIYMSFGSLWFIVSMLLLGGSVAPYFAPTRYKMTEEGVEAFQFFHTTRKTWENFRSYYEDKRGVLLSPFDRPSRLENYRGLYLRFGDRRDEVMMYIKRRLNVEGLQVEDPEGRLL